jgi:hypothetical protein
MLVIGPVFNSLPDGSSELSDGDHLIFSPVIESVLSFVFRVAVGDVSVTFPSLAAPLRPSHSNQLAGSQRLRSGLRVMMQDSTMPRLISTEPRMALGALSQVGSVEWVAAYIFCTLIPETMHALCRVRE